jgi:hypothetical protein
MHFSILSARDGLRRSAGDSLQTREVLPQRGMAFAHHPALGLPGVQDGDDGPFERPLEAGCREKVSESANGAFDGWDPLVWLSSPFLGGQVLPQRGHGTRIPTLAASAAQGSVKVIVAPPAGAAA